MIQDKQIDIQITNIEVKIPKNALGLVIGRHGTNIKQIEEKTSTSIHFIENNSMFFSFYNVYILIYFI